MVKFVKERVMIAPINSSEEARLLYVNPLKTIKGSEIPEDKRVILRWMNTFKEKGLDFDTGKVPDGVSYDDLTLVLDYNTVIKYSPEFNTGIIHCIGKYCSLPTIMLRQENYFMICEYEEVYPSLNEVMDVPLNDLVEYLQYLADKKEAAN